MAAATVITWRPATSDDVGRLCRFWCFEQGGWWFARIEEVRGACFVVAVGDNVRTRNAGRVEVQEIKGGGEVSISATNGTNEVTEQEAREAAARRKAGGYTSDDDACDDEAVLIEWAMQELANREPFSLEQLSANPDAVVRQSPPPDALQQLTDVQAKLAAYRDVCQRLWPFVRYFIIAGACPEAINCVVDLGRLLGHTEASKSTIAEIGERVRAETLDEVAAQLETLLRGKVLSKYLPEVLDAVRKL